MSEEPPPITETGGAAAPTTPNTPAEPPNLRAKLQEVPHKPGIYIMRDRFDRVIYVGKARDLRKRLSSYFMPSRKMRADPKTRALLESIRDFEIRLVRSEPEALLLEGRMIKEFRPRYNVSFRDDKRFLLVRVDLREEWPRLHLARYRKDDGSRYFGPFAYAGALRQTLKFLRKKYGVMTFGRGAPSEREKKYSCYQVPSRLSDLTAEQYRERVLLACEVLDGDSGELVDTLQKEMEEAAGNLDFERAAELRNMISDLKATTKPMRRFTRTTSLPSVINPAQDLAALGDALQLEFPPRIMECFDISNISTAHVVASMVCFRDGVPDKANYRRYRITSISGQDDFASMAEVIRRRYSRILLESQNPDPLRPRVRLPDLVIVDGGKGQLSAAMKELDRLGLGTLPTIGLAKQHEEIFRPGRPLPLVLPHDSGALKLLQRIRDEAHRFANGYHQLLMKRRIAESVLDDCPGVSDARKQALLQEFGSIRKLRSAPLEEIAAVSGIGPKLAERIVKFLEERSASADT